MKTNESRKTDTAPATLIAAVFAAGCLTAETTAPAWAEGKPEVIEAEFIPDAGGAERVDHAGRLRMFSQRIAVAACHIHAGIEVDAYKKIASDSAADFDRFLNALEFGDSTLNINGAETKRKTLDAISAIKAEWTPFAKATAAVVDGSDTEGGMRLIAERNMELLSLSQKLVTIISAEYANPAEMLLADALLIDISGRQAMISEKIAKELCAANTGNTLMGNTEGMQKALDLFEKSHMALRDGNESVGIKPPPMPEIAAGLDEVWAVWQKTRPEAEKVTGPGSVDAAVLSEIEHALEEICKKMVAITALYDKASKLEI